MDSIEILYHITTNQCNVNIQIRISTLHSKGHKKHFNSISVLEYVSCLASRVILFCKCFFFNYYWLEESKTRMDKWKQCLSKKLHENILFVENQDHIKYVGILLETSYFDRI